MKIHVPLMTINNNEWKVRGDLRRVSTNWRIGYDAPTYHAWYVPTTQSHRAVLGPTCMQAAGRRIFSEPTERERGGGVALMLALKDALPC